MKREEVRIGQKVHSGPTQKMMHPERVLEIVSRVWDDGSALEGVVKVRKPGRDLTITMFVSPLILADDQS